MDFFDELGAVALDLDDAQPMTPEEVAEYERHEESVFAVACWLMERDGDEHEPHDMIWSCGTIPEPWGEAWQRYEDDARKLVGMVLSANA